MNTLRKNSVNKKSEFPTQSFDTAMHVHELHSAKEFGSRAKVIN